MLVDRVQVSSIRETGVDIDIQDGQDDIAHGCG